MVEVVHLYNIMDCISTAMCCTDYEQVLEVCVCIYAYEYCLTNIIQE